MPLDFKVEKIRLVSGSMEWTISSVAIANPNGVLTEPSGSIIRAQDGTIWTNTNGGTTWVNTGPSAFSSLSGTINARFFDVTGSLISSIASTNTSLRAGVTASFSDWAGNLYVRSSITGALDLSITRNATIGGSLSTGSPVSVRGTNAEIYVSGSTSQWIRFATSNAGVPAFGTRSVGTKVILYDQLDNDDLDYAIGIEPAATWFVIPRATVDYSYKFYGGTTQLMRLYGDGALEITNGFTAQKLTASLDARVGRNVTVIGGVSTQRLTASLDASIGRDLFVTGNLAVQGSITGSGKAVFERDVQFNDSVLALGAPNQSSIAASQATGNTDSVLTLSSLAGGSFDTTSGDLASYAVFGTVYSSRSNGPNLLNQAGGAFVASGSVPSINYSMGVLAQGEGGLSASFGVYGTAFGSPGFNYGGYFSNENPYGLPEAGPSYALFARGTTKVIGDLHVTGTIFASTIAGVAGGAIAGSTTNFQDLYVTGSITGSGDATFGRDVAVAGTLTAGSIPALSTAYANLQTGVTASIGSIYTTILAGTSASDGTYYTTILAGTSASDAAVQTSLKAGVTASFSNWAGDFRVQGSITGSGDALFSRNINVSRAITAGAAGTTHAFTGESQFHGTDYITHLNYLGATEQHTYIRAGKLGGQVIIGDVNTGSIQLGSSNNNTYVNGIGVFGSTYTYFTNAEANLLSTATNGNIYIKSNGGTLNLNPTAGNGAVSIAAGGGITTIHGPLNIPGTATASFVQQLNTGKLMTVWYDDTGQVGTFAGRQIQQVPISSFDLTDFNPGGQANSYSVRVVGWVKPAYSETYQFYSTADDGQRLWVSGTLLIDNWIDQGPNEENGSIALTAGVWYPIIGEHYENAGGQAYKLEWSSPSQTREVLGTTADTIAYSGYETSPSRFHRGDFTREVDVGMDLRVKGQVTASCDMRIGRSLTIEGFDEVSTLARSSLTVLGGFAAGSSSVGLTHGGTFNVGGNYDTQVFYKFISGISSSAKGKRVIGSYPLFNIGVQGAASGSENDAQNVGMYGQGYGSGSMNVGVYGEAYEGLRNYGGFFSIYNGNTDGAPTAGAENYAIFASGNVMFKGNLYITGSIIGASGLGTIGGSGTSNKVAKFSAGSTITDSTITDDGSTVTVGAANGLNVTNYAVVNGMIYGGSNLALAGNELHFMRSTNATDTGYINYYGYNDSTGHFRNLWIADGKGGGITYYDAATKRVDFYGDVTVASSLTSSQALKVVDARTAKVPTANYPAALYVFATGTWNTAASSAQNVAVYGAATSGKAGTNAVLNYGVRGEASNGGINIGVYGKATGSATVNYGGYFVSTDGTSNKAIYAEGGVTVTHNLDVEGAVSGNLQIHTDSGRAARRLINTQILTSSTGSYTPTAGTKCVRLRAVGGGGGGGGAPGGAGVAVGGGGSSGQYLEKWLDPGNNTDITGGGYGVGAAGTGGGSTAGTQAGYGGDTSIVIQGTLFTAKGGVGGYASVNNTAIHGYLPGWINSGTGANAAGTFASVAMDAIAAGQGQPGLYFPGYFAYGGPGGSNPLGTGGGFQSTGNQAGVVGYGYGGGGGGACATNVNQTGAAGTVGIIIIEEYA